MCKEVRIWGYLMNTFPAKVKPGDAVPFYLCSHAEVAKGWRLRLWGQWDGCESQLWLLLVGQPQASHLTLRNLIFSLFFKTEV